jgi:hypothetical protein
MKGANAGIASNRLLDIVLIIDSSRSMHGQRFIYAQGGQSAVFWSGRSAVYWSAMKSFVGTRVYRYQIIRKYTS